jgi:hypothetical protein
LVSDVEPLDLEVNIRPDCGSTLELQPNPCEMCAAALALDAALADQAVSLATCDR